MSGEVAGVPVAFHELDNGWSWTWLQGTNPPVRFELEFVTARRQWLQRMAVGDQGGWCSPVVLDLPKVYDADGAEEVAHGWIAQRLSSGP